MNRQNRAVHIIPTIIGRSAVPALFFFLVLTGWAYGAGSQLELDIGELDKGVKPAGAPKDKPARPAKKPAAKSPARPKRTPAVQRKGEYFEYTIRPGDHIHGLLTSRFGLSTSRAEELTPVIMRINGISNPSALRVGQTILIPASVKKAAMPVQPGEVQTEIPVKPAAPIPGTTATENAKASPPPQSAVRPLEGAEELLIRIRKFWSALSPEKVTSADDIREKTVGATRYPVITARDGKEILIAPAGAPPVFENISGARSEAAKPVVVDPADGKKLASILLNAAGYEGVEEHVPFRFGDDPKLRLTADFMGVKKVAGNQGSPAILVMAGHEGCLPTPEALAVFLAGKGYRFAEWCEEPLIKAATLEIRVYSVPSGRTEEIVDALLGALSLRWSRDYPVDVVVGRKDAPPLRVKVDRYFEEQGERFFVDFEKGDPGRAAFVRMLELAGYRRIAVNARDDLRSITAKLMKPLNINAEYRRQVFAFHGRYSVEVTGVLLPGSADSGKIPFVTDVTMDPLFSELITSGQWDIQ